MSPLAALERRNVARREGLPQSAFGSGVKLQVKA